MSNIFTQNPIILDTAWTSGTIPSALTDPSRDGQNYSKVVWVGPTTPGHYIEITDLAGNVIIKRYCAVADQDVVVWDHSGNNKALMLKQGKWILSHIGSGEILLYR